MKNQERADEMASNRYQLLSPLLQDSLDQAKVRQLKEQICAQTGLSERTLRRYLSQYRQTGFQGLKPKSRGRPKAIIWAVPDDILTEAIVLRREVPSRSISQIIQILEWEKRIEPGRIKRSTLQEKLAEKGYSSRHMRLYANAGTAARRFQRRSRNALWHSDIKFGPFLPIGPNHSPKQVYLVLFLDDATRLVLHGQFYATLDQVIIEDCFRQAVQNHGAPEAAFFDNGKQYRNKWMARACSKMGIRLLFAKPYSPEATGKIERVNRVVDSFLAEVRLENPRTLTRLNELFWIWLDECYQNKAHSGLKDNLSPQTTYNSDPTPLRFLDPQTIALAFQHCEDRKVDKAGCISFMGEKYEAGLHFVGCIVTVIYDPADISVLTLEYEGHEPWQATKLVIGERTGPRPKLPERMLPQPAKSSRLLQSAAEQNSKRQKQQVTAVSFRRLVGEGHV